MNSRLRDLEVRHRTESATKEARLVQNQITELEHLNYAISHDLKGPLLTIRAFADLLGQDLGANDTSKVSGDLNWIRGAASTMQKRVSALLKLSQIRTQQSPFVIVDMHAIAQEVVDSLGGPISERGSIVEIQPNLPNVYGDTETLGHVLQNLVENALKFAKPGSIPKIEIGARDDARGVVFFVKDNGIGIKPKYHETIFHLFERLDPGVDGSGVGLALVSRIVENHDGKAWVDSAKNRGCTMCFVLGTEQIPQTAPFRPRIRTIQYLARPATTHNQA